MKNYLFELAKCTAGDIMIAVRPLTDGVPDFRVETVKVIIQDFLDGLIAGAGRWMA